MSREYSSYKWSVMTTSLKVHIMASFWLFACPFCSDLSFPSTCMLCYWTRKYRHYDSAQCYFMHTIQKAKCFAISCSPRKNFRIQMQFALLPFKNMAIPSQMCIYWCSLFLYGYSSCLWKSLYIYHWVFVELLLRWFPPATIRHNEHSWPTISSLFKCMS